MIQSRINRKKTTLYEKIFAPPYLFCFLCILNLADKLARDVRGRHQTSHVRKTGTIHPTLARLTSTTHSKSTHDTSTRVTARESREGLRGLWEVNQNHAQAMRSTCTRLRLWDFQDVSQSAKEMST